MTIETDDSLEALARKDDDDFRLAVRTWIVTNYPSDRRNPMNRPHRAESFFWYKMLSDKGWIAPGWPQEHGGMGLSAIKQLIFLEEQERYGCTRVNDLGIMLVGPVLIKHGTPEQKARFLPRIISGEDIWCQGYSEPNAGSDLASLRTEAVLDADEWVINGQKIWTTLANDANWIFLLVRTNKQVKQQSGISFLLVPLDTPGITVRPIVTLDMHDEFCEVFFDDVRVPKGSIIGEIDRGWTIAKSLLGFERVFTGTPRSSIYCLGRLRMLAEHLGSWDDPVFQDRFTRLRLDLEDHKALYETFVEKVRKGAEIGPEVSILKTNQTELYMRITDLMLELGGEYAGLSAPIDGNRDLRPAAFFIQARPASITSGTSQIQRNIIAKSILHLPS
ncbi:MAG: acyl-CoA dehydrogenase family protein [Acetobacteraceae bacterium]|nr:acyl-CoA dehydrogenase family protein [Acetobacteraceae bacterium]